MKINYNQEDLCSHHGVSAVIKNSDGDILMQHHVKFGFWTIPIEKAKCDQDPVDAIKEGVFEECNLNVGEVKEIAFKEIKYIRNGKEVFVPTHVYEVLDYSGELKNNEPHKHAEQKFLPLEEIKKIPYLSDCTVLFLESIGFGREARID